MLIFSIVIGLATIMLTTWSMNQIVLKYIDQLETNLIEKKFNELNLILARETKSLVGISRDWACWDDTYFYMAGELNGYEEKNLQEDILKKINLNIMLFLNKDGTIEKSVRADMNDDHFPAFEEKLIDK